MSTLIELKQQFTNYFIYEEGTVSFKDEQSSVEASMLLAELQTMTEGNHEEQEEVAKMVAFFNAYL